uniref:NADH-ubiquinone oxidoreductase chain 2 n=1 Tax=Hypothenemus sp. BMNH 1039837 TaxID=1903764 RepID=A0A343A5M2_9CUCU|nr:NADH dehydrogenase subunit 2 [Hypothenemus sp. BMNH 1039837]
MFIILLGSSTMISISASSWLIAWLGLEINLLSFIPLMKTMNKFNSEAMIKYFIIQAMASMLLMMSIVLISSKMKNPEFLYTSMMVSSPLLMKMGAAPFHFWFPEVMSGLEWMTALMLATWQKIAPSVLLSFTSSNMNFMVIIVLMSISVGSIQSMNQQCLRKLIAYSSINNIGWMLPAVMMNMNIWLLYFTVYTIINMGIILTWKNAKIFFISQLNKMFHSNKTLKVTSSMALLSLGGLPPFLGFLPKWMIIQTMSTHKMFTIITMMVIITLIMLFVYTRMLMSTLSMSSSESLKSNKNNMSTMNFLSIYGLVMCFMMF